MFVSNCYELCFLSCLLLQCVSFLFYCRSLHVFLYCHEFCISIFDLLFCIDLFLLSFIAGLLRAILRVLQVTSTDGATTSNSTSPRGVSSEACYNKVLWVAVPLALRGLSSASVSLAPKTSCDGLSILSICNTLSQ